MSVFYAEKYLMSSKFVGDQSTASERNQNGLVSMVYQSVINGNIDLINRIPEVYEYLHGYKAAAGRASKYLLAKKGRGKLSDAQKEVFKVKRAEWGVMEERHIYAELLEVCFPQNAAESAKPKKSNIDKLKSYLDKQTTEWMRPDVAQAYTALVQALESQHSQAVEEGISH